MTSRSQKNKNLLVPELFCAVVTILLIVAGTSRAQDRESVAQAQSAQTSFAGGGNRGVASSVPGQTEVEGEFQVIHEDFKHSGRYIYYLKTTQGLIPLHFAKNPPTNLLSGAHVRVRGTPQPNGSVMLMFVGRCDENRPPA